MRRSLVTPTAFLMVGLFSSSLTGFRAAEQGETSGPLAREILDVKHQYDEAQLKNDGAWFKRMFADDYVFTLPDSSVVTKTEFIKDLESRDLVWESVSGKDMKVRVYSNTAVVTGRFFGKGRYKGAILDEHQRFTSVWIKRNGHWQAISEHASSLPQASK
jgi:ketosteroid isomerase-like protein